MPVPPRIRCRQIGAADCDAIADLLTAGFRVRPRAFWVRALERLSAHPTPQGYPKFGYLLEANGAAVGVLLLIYSAVSAEPEAKIRCNVSSWYVAPAFRSYAAMFVSYAQKQSGVTYFNITPDPATLPILEAQGYTRYCSGRFVSVPIASAAGDRCRAQPFTAEPTAVCDLPAAEAELLQAHARHGCISLVCRGPKHSSPFVFLPLRKTGFIPYAYLAYCRQVEDFVRFARPLGKLLCRHGIVIVVLDANGPVEGLTGRYLNGAPKYFKGPDRPRLGDIAYSERVLFGF